ncbi:MAG TPA: hypothetical protein VGH04_08005 [Gemmatimonadaceae bacterium]
MSVLAPKAKSLNGRRADPNPVRAQFDWPAAVIAGAYRTGVLGMRSLARRGVRVALVDCDTAQSGFRSAHGPAYACPNPDVDPRGWVAGMADVARRMGEAGGGRPVLISSADQFTSAIAANADRLGEHFVLSPGARLQGLLATKETQYQLAVQHGMPLPRTAFARSAEDVREFAAAASFPCLIKPGHFREWQAFPRGHRLAYAKVAVASDGAELLECWRLASAVNPNVIVQEVIGGPDTAKRVYVSCYNADSRRIAHAMFRELRCDPIGFGPASVTEPIVDAETDAVCDRFLRSIAFSGICEIEMKIDSRDDRPRMIEANPRLSGSGDAAPYAGVDTCWLHYLDLIGRPVEPVAPNGRDFRHITLRSDASAVFEHKRAGTISWTDVLHSYKPPLAFFDLDRGDWRYSAQTVALAIRSALGELRRSMVRARTRPAPKSAAK